LRASDTVQRCRSLVLTNGDKIEISKYLIYRKGGGLCVGRAEEILVELETDSVIGILISACLIGPDVMPYRLPSCTLQENQRLMVAFNVSGQFCNFLFPRKEEKKLTLPEGTRLRGER
jgi:hypothetical protein